MKNYKLLIVVLIVGLSLGNCKKKDPYTKWEHYRGDQGANCYSTLDHINKDNVTKLERAWIFHSGDAREDNRSTIECNPLIVKDKLFITSPELKLFALDAATGEEIWMFDPISDGGKVDVNRGLTYWEEGKDKRIFFPVSERYYAINAETGEIIRSFGENGYIDFREGLDRDVEKITAASSSPGVIYKDLLITGHKVSEGDGAAPGHIRAYDVRTGEMKWRFNTIPHPGEFGYETWEDPDSWKKIGGANSWAGLALDEERGIVFCPTGSASPDFYGGYRKGQGLFADCLIALNAETGERIWHFQVVHHNIWDYDIPSTPNLITIRRDGRTIDAVAQITKMGHMFVFDRVTGEPVFPIEERPVPQSDIEGEQSWPTQPFPLAPPAFVKQRYTRDDLPTISEESRKFAIEKLAAARNEGIFTPLSHQGTVVFPGFRGGAEWSGASFDFETGIMYINANQIPNLATIRRAELYETGTVGRDLPGRRLYQMHCALCHGLERKGVEVFPTLIGIEKKMNREQIDSMIRLGKGLMPPFPQLSDEERKAISGYVLGTEIPSNIQPLDPEIAKLPRFVSSGYAQFLDPQGYPAVKPPWGTLNAIDMNKGEILWQKPLGEFPELIAKGIPPTGTQNFGGCLVTKGGVLFIGATADEKFRAFDKHTGEILWEYLLPFGGYATPATYEVNGEQYVVIAAGGGGKVGTKSGDAVVAFKLKK